MIPHQNHASIPKPVQARLACFALLFVLLTGTSLLADRSRNAPEPDIGKYETQSLYERSSVTLSGLRLAIQSLQWKRDHLEVIFVSEFDKKSTSSWVFLHPWFRLHVSFWDSRQVQMSQSEIAVDCTHDPDFMFYKKTRETHTFFARIPTEARLIAIQYGTGPYFTKPVPIPHKP